MKKIFLITIASAFISGCSTMKPGYKSKNIELDEQMMKEIEEQLQYNTYHPKYY